VLVGPGLMIGWL